MPELKAELKLSTQNFVKSLEDAVLSGTSNFNSILEAAKKFEVEVNSKIPAGLKALTSSMGETKKLATNFEQGQAQAGRFLSELKLAAAEMTRLGQTGTEAFAKIKTQIAETEHKLLQYNTAAGKGVAHAPAAEHGGEHGGFLKETGSTMLGMAGGGILLGGLQGAGQMFESFLEKGKEAMETTEGLEIAFKAAGLSGGGLEKEMERVNSSSSTTAQRFGVTATAVKEVARQAAFLGGATGKTNEDITNAAVGIEKLSHGMLSSTMVIRAFTKGGTEGTESLGRLTMQFPRLAEALKGLSTPQEKAAAANAFLAESFQTLAESPLTKLENAQNAVEASMKTIGSTMLDIVMPILLAGGKAITWVGGAINDTFAFLKTNSETIVPILAAVAGVIGVVTIAIYASTIAAKAKAAGDLIMVGVQAVVAAYAWIAAAGFSGLAAAVWAALAPLLPFIAAAALLGVGMYALAGGFEKSAESKLKDAEASEKNIEKSIELEQKNKKQQQTNLEMIASWKKLGEEYQKTGKGQDELNKKTAELSKIYPDVLLGSENFAKNLEILSKKGEEAANSIGNIDKSLEGLEAMKENIIELKVRLTLEKSVDEFINEVQGGFWGKVNTFMAHGIDIAGDRYKAQMKGIMASGSMEIARAIANSAKMDIEKDYKDDPDKKVKLEEQLLDILAKKEQDLTKKNEVANKAARDASLKEQIDKYIAHVKGLSVTERETQKTTLKEKLEDYIKNLDEVNKKQLDSTGKTLSYYDKERKSLNDTIKLLEKKAGTKGVDHEKYFKEQELEREKIKKDTGKKIADAELKGLEAEKDSVLSNTTLTEEERAKIIARIDEKILLRRQSAEQATLESELKMAKDAVDKKAEAEKKLKGADTSKIDEDAEKTKLLLDKQYKILFNMQAFEFLNQQTKAARKADEDITKGQVEDLDKRLNAIKLGSIKEIEEYKKVAAEKLKIEYAKTLGVKGDRTAVQEAQYIEYLNKRNELDLKAQEALINLGTDLTKNKYLVELNQLANKYQLERDLYKDNADKLLALEEDYQAQRNEVTRKYLSENNAIYQAAEAFQEGLKELFVDKNNAENEKQAKGELKTLEKQSVDLKKQLDRKEITYNQYAEKESQLHQQKAEKESQIEKSKITVWTKINGVFYKTSTLLLDKYSKKFDNDLKENVKSSVLMGDAFNMMGAAMLEAISSGKNVAKAVGSMLLDILEKTVSAKLAELLAGLLASGPSTATLGAAGYSAYAVQSANIAAAAAGARAILAGGDSGIWSVGNDNQSPSSRDVYPRMLRKGERVFTPEMLEGNEKITAAIFAGNKLDKGGSQASSHNFAFQHEFSNARVTSKAIEWAVTKSQRSRLRSMG